MRLLISDILSECERFKVIATAQNGKEAVEKTLKLRPNIVLMDMEMGEYGGIYGVNEIMKRAPTPIIILSSVGNKNMGLVFEALDAGAIDYMNKPASGHSKIRRLKEELFYKVNIASTSKLLVSGKRLKSEGNVNFINKKGFGIMVIGGSTGGPKAIEILLSGIPSNWNIPIVIAQHMPRNFVKPFATRLSRVLGTEVSVAYSGSTIRAGVIWVCDNEVNLQLIKSTDGELSTVVRNKDFPEYNHPSIDCLFFSASTVFGKKSIGILLSGMGKDGARGLLAIKSAGGATVAQDEKTSVIYGMPRAAKELQAPEHVLPIHEIAPFLRKLEQK